MIVSRSRRQWYGGAAAAILLMTLGLLTAWRGMKAAGQPPRQDRAHRSVEAAPPSLRGLERAPPVLLSANARLDAAREVIDAPSAAPGECPATSPVDGDTCTLPPDTSLRCGYESADPVICECNVISGKISIWRCSPEDAGRAAACPAHGLQSGSQCASVGLVCFVGDASERQACTCVHDNPSVWNCTSYLEWMGPR